MEKKMKDKEKIVKLQRELQDLRNWRKVAKKDPVSYKQIKKHIDYAEQEREVILSIMKLKEETKMKTK